jgi:hypothetical protein
MNPAQSLKIELIREDGRPAEVKGVFFSICFFMSSVYRFAFRTPSTDEKGQVVVSYNEIERARKINLKHQPMDFKTTLDECDPVVVVRTPTAEEMREASRTVHQFEATEYFDDAEQWLHSSNGMVRAEELQVKLGRGQTVARIPCCLE